MTDSKSAAFLVRGGDLQRIQQIHWTKIDSLFWETGMENFFPSSNIS